MTTPFAELSGIDMRAGFALALGARCYICGLRHLTFVGCLPSFCDEVFKRRNPFRIVIVGSCGYVPPTCWTFEGFEPCAAPILQICVHGTLMRLTRLAVMTRFSGSLRRFRTKNVGRSEKPSSVVYVFSVSRMFTRGESISINRIPN